MAATSGLHIGGKLCEIFGLKQVTKLSLTCPIDDCAILEATMLADHDAAEDAVEELKRYRLVEIVDDEGGIEPGARD